MQIGGRGLVGEMHHDPAGRAGGDDVRIGALLGGGLHRALAVGLLVVGGEPPAPDNVL